ncbi:MAG: YifB family Mg chelatase-like AAA ATPase [Butyrivibrio sp.]|nr:YifB family Mg chelatase-like AAA ATPase [Butyrivibrio sp.]
MFSSVTSGAARGVSPYLMQVEVDVSEGLPGFNMVGFMSGEVKEAAERVKVALKNAGSRLPVAKITVNLSPVAIRKSGVVIDLPVAVGILAATGEIRKDSLDGTMILGELSLDGEVKGVRGVLPIVKKAAECGFKRVILPEENATEGAVTGGIKVIGVKSLQEALLYLNAPDDEKDSLIEPTVVDLEKLFSSEESFEGDGDFSDISGQAAVKRAVEIAAAGFHHLLVIGPPGAGKSMVAKRMPTILPPLSPEESLDVTTIYSVAGALPEGVSLLRQRPFVSAHHTITESALVGGGNTPRPGLISLAHRGVLFLDEMPEFPRARLDLLRQPMEDRRVHIVRSKGTYTFPSDFQLIGAMNPCPCGYYPDRNRCRCTAGEIKRYLGHISGPILDRVDICVEAPRVEIGDLSNRGKRALESSAAIRKRVMAVRDIQKERFKGRNIRFNSEMSPRDIEEFCRLGKDEELFLENAFVKMDLSARAYHKVLRVARTIADIDGTRDIGRIHLIEALGYRGIDGKYWNNTEEQI